MPEDLRVICTGIGAAVVLMVYAVSLYILLKSLKAGITRAWKRDYYVPDVVACEDCICADECVDCTCHHEFRGDLV